MKKDTITILGKTYEVVKSDDIAIGGYMGLSNQYTQKIAIANNISKDQEEETLIHEVIHIIDMELSLGLSEETVARLAVGLYSAGFTNK